jgi:hypothetical protein
MRARLLKGGLQAPAQGEPPSTLAAVTSNTVLRKADGSCSPSGSRTSTQRIGAGGSPLCASRHFAADARIVRSGNAHVRPAQGIGTSTIK